MAVELALTPDGRWQISTEDLVEAAGSAGFSALGLSADRADARSAACLRRAGLRCHEVLALVLGDDDEQEATSAASKLAEAADAVAAPWVLTTFHARPGTSARIIRECAARLAESGAAMAVEFSPLGPVGSIDAALEVVSAAGADRAGIVIDSWHLSFSPNGWAELGRVPLELIAYVQFTDALEPVSPELMRETMHRRAMPGEGVLDLHRFASTLLGRGWGGVVSVEVLNREMRELPVPEFARRAHAATVPFWS